MVQAAFSGNQVRHLREQLGLTQQQFASLLGVHSTTLYRWEASGLVALRIEPFQLQILRALQQQIERPGNDLAEALGKALLVGGGLLALYVLLQDLFEKPRSG